MADDWVANERGANEQQLYLDNDDNNHSDKDNDIVNVTVPEERSATAIGYKRARDTRNKVNTLRMAILRGTLPCSWLVYCDFRFA